MVAFSDRRRVWSEMRATSDAILRSSVVKRPRPWIFSSMATLLFTDEVKEPST